MVNKIRKYDFLKYYKARVQTNMNLGTLNRARMLEHRIQHHTEMPKTCWNIFIQQHKHGYLF